MKIALTIIALIVVAMIAYLLIRKTSQPDDARRGPYMVPGAEMYVEPESAGQARASRLLPVEGSEDVSHLLNRQALPQALQDSDVGERDYLPEPKIHWIVNLESSNEAAWTKDEVLAVFSNEWFVSNGHPALFGKLATSGRWTYVHAGDVEGPFLQLRFGLRLCEARGGTVKTTSDAELAKFLESIRHASTPLAPSKVQPASNPADGAKLASNLARLANECNQSATIVLLAPYGKRFEGKEIWDVMLCLGLTWGDMDVFHWDNDREVGDDARFSVWASAPPGFFLPESIAAGELNTQDLIFGFSIPRSADPTAIGKSMANAARYAMKRLGGTLLDAEGSPFDEEAMLGRVTAVVSKLHAAGFVPGDSATLQLF